MLLSNYTTKTEIRDRENKTVDGFWPVGIDYGFSAVKGFSPNKIFCFPNCAVPVDSFASLVDPSSEDIYLRDKNGMWIIGAKAHELIKSGEAMNYEPELYGRNRYFSPSFRAVMKAGLGIALIGNTVKKYQNEPIVVQTGLPHEYKSTDTDLLMDTLEGTYDFDLRVGTKPFQHFHFVIERKNIMRLMDQPMGSLFSAITDDNGEQGALGRKVLTSDTLVFDPGFKTFDTYEVASGKFRSSNTYDTLGMHEVFQRTVRDLRKKYNADLSVLGMQDLLRKGYVVSLTREMGRIKTYRKSFDDELEKNTKDVCMEAIQKVLSVYNYLQYHDYLIVTGGTGNAWFSIIEDYFRDMENLTILSANRNDTTLSNTYSNARGYYFFLIGMLQRRKNGR